MSAELIDVDGVHVTRLEDLRLIQGAGRYASDWNLPGQLHAAFVRADRAHARIVRVNSDAARAHRGVAAVYTGEDAIKAGYVNSPQFTTFAGKGGQKIKLTPRPVMTSDKVRFVGDLVAMVVADTAAIAQDAAELIEVDYEDLPSVTNMMDALGKDAPAIHDAIPGNLCFEYEAGDEKAVADIFARAAHVSRLTMESPRVVPSPMEPRACVAAYDKSDDSFTVHTCLQGANMMRRQLSLYTGVPEEKLHVIAKDIGGGFGQRSTGYPEYCALMLASRALGRPVKWISTRSEAFQSDTHGRGNVITGQLALDGKGHFLAMRIEWDADMGAYLSPAGPSSNIRNPTTCINGVYHIPVVYGYWRAVLTNTAPIAAYRGAGRPDIAFMIERLINFTAAESGHDPVELRRINFIKPEAFPYKTPLGSVYDVGDFPGVLEDALKLADWDGYEARRKASAASGRLRGRGISTVIENTGNGMYPKDEIELEVHADGRVTAYSVSHSQGQGHATTFAMVIGRALGIPPARVTLVQGQDDKRLIGNHSGGSRTMVGAGTVCHLAAEKLIEVGKSLAAEHLSVEPSQVEFADGGFRSKATKKTLSLGELAALKPLLVKAEGSYGTTYPNGCHIAEIEVDPDTGVTTILSYVTVDDCGTVVNHAIVEGQMQGAIAQGAGQVFGEHTVYDRESGQLMTGSFSDYTMPRAGWLPELKMAEHPTYGTMNPLGIKGMGESGCTASLGALTNAMMDALSPYGIRHIDMPFTPGRVWSAIRAARATTQ
jgi:carbon-monoxide dehydrogenase large subunit